MTWQERCRKMILASTKPVMIEATETWGIFQVIADLPSPLFWLDLSPKNARNPNSISHELFRAVTRTLGEDLLDDCLPLPDLLVQFNSIVAKVRNATIVVTNTDDFLDLRKELICLFQNDTRLIFTAKQLCNEDRRRKDTTIFSYSAFRLSLIEAKEIIARIGGSAHLTDQNIAEILRTCGYSYEPFIVEVSRRFALPAPKRPTPDGYIRINQPMTDESAILRYFVRERRWIDAFELAVDMDSGEALHLLSRAAVVYSKNGLFERFWQRLSLLDESRIFSDAEAAYWYVFTASSVNKLQSILPKAHKLLSCSSAPNLRALCATLENDSQSTLEAQRAHLAGATIRTGRALGLRLGIDGKHDLAFKTLYEALTKAERVNAAYEIVATALNISNLYLFLGNLQYARQWGEYAAARYTHHGLKDQILWLCVENHRIFPSLLLSDSPDQVPTEWLANQMIDGASSIPTVEAACATLGDLALATDKLDIADTYFKQNHACATRTTIGQFSLDYVRLLVHKTEYQYALEVAEEALMMANETSKINEGSAQLAYGIAISKLHLPSSTMYFQQAIESFASVNYTLGVVHASVQYAKTLISQDQTPEALRQLARCDVQLKQFGKMGWKYLLGSPIEFEEVYQAFTQGSYPLRLNLLGIPKVYLGRKLIRLSQKQLETLTLLTANPMGLSLPSLTFGLYGSDVSETKYNTTKSIISRLRQYVSISSQPYMLCIPVEADFVRVQDLLAAGKIHAAMEIYTGSLLPTSDAPGIVEIRSALENSLKLAAISEGDAVALTKLCSITKPDLEVWEALLKVTHTSDPKYHWIAAKVQQIQSDWEN